ncbi:MAG: hypothetical protein JO194_01720 [Candidatus Eremiobacteraeota bacterium]|nr:hypothetical protein [Candidatus Eremiobacteraeota bacterium]
MRANWLIGVTIACALLLASCSSNSATLALPSTPNGFASNAQIWMHPKPYIVAPPPTGGGAVDFLALFQSDASWADVAAHTAVFGLYAGWVLSIDDPTLAQAASFLNAHHMAVELEVPSLQATAACGNGVEGFVPNFLTVHDVTLTYLQRLRALGVNVAYLKVDEPFYFGSVITSDPLASSPPCHWSVNYVAQQVAQFAQLVHTVYPNAQVGDIEPVIASAYSPDVVTALTQWHSAFAAAAGAPFPFYIADIDFSNPTWPALVKTLESSTRAAGMKFGILYIGDLQDSSDQIWASKSIARFEQYQGSEQGKPDFVLFQSWMPHPTRCLPETDQTTMTGVVEAYLKATGAAKARTR